MTDVNASGVARLRELHRLGIDAVNRREPAAAAALYAADAIVHDPFYPEPLRGCDAIRADYEAFFRAVPDIRAEAKGVFIDDDRIAYEMRVTGTHTGPLATPDGEIPPTGRPLVLEIGVFARVDGEGRVRRQHRYYDTGGLLRQLGLDQG